MVSSVKHENINEKWKKIEINEMSSKTFNSKSELSLIIDM